MKLIDPNNYSAIILQLTLSEWNQFLQQPLSYLKFKDKIHAELPKFIPEGKAATYRNLFKRFYQLGIGNFFISHLSQKLILPEGAKVSTNENVYLFSDAAIRFVKDENIRSYILPLENDIANMNKGTDRNGIVPVYFYPHLFYSRMPVDLKKDTPFADKNGESYLKYIRDGITIVTPTSPVSITQNREKVERFGFNRFLIDMSFTVPSKDLLQFVFDKLMNNEAIEKTSIFNFKRELK